MSGEDPGEAGAGRERGLERAVWRKSSRSNGSGGNNCVEVMSTSTGVFVRNSRQPAGAMLKFTDAEWEAFLAGARDGEFDLGGDDG